MHNPLAALAHATFDDAVDLDARVRALVTHDFRFRQEGRCTDVEGYLQHVHQIRAAMTHGELVVLDELLDDSTPTVRVAARVHVRMTMLDGSSSEGEAHLLGALHSRRLSILHESGRLLLPGDDPPQHSEVHTAPEASMRPRLDAASPRPPPPRPCGGPGATGHDRSPWRAAGGRPTPGS